MYGRKDTIAAIATAQGQAALGIVRISGPKAAAALRAVAPRARASYRPRQVILSKAYHPRSGELIDEVLCFFCPGPGTATGEDIAELQGHGGPLVMHRLLDAVLSTGTVAAQPGEFTFRAFDNGRLDLTQAEAVMGLIGARSTRAQKVALRQLDGELGSSLDHEFNELIGISAHVEASLDFPDEDLPLDESETLATRLEKIEEKLSTLTQSFALGTMLKDGAEIAIVGPPNAGKSSLLNRLVAEERAIVDRDPGTTRDVVEARGEVAGIPVVFKDTAGLRNQVDRVERRGIEKTLESIGRADLVILVVDGAVQNEEYNKDLVDLIPESLSNLIIAVNKKDLADWQKRVDLPFAKGAAPSQIVPTSAMTGQGIVELLDLVAKKLNKEDDENAVILTTARQQQAVVNCLEHVQKASRLLRQRSDPELVAADLRWAREALATLWGRSPTDEVIDAIFSTFCLGK